MMMGQIHQAGRSAYPVCLAASPEMVWPWRPDVAGKRRTEGWQPDASYLIAESFAINSVALVL